MNILLHICCAPCSIYPIEVLRKAGHQIAGYYYNPNVHPYSEFLKRKAEVEKLSKESGVNVTFGDYELEHYFQYMVFNEAAHTAREIRCPACWWMRLEKTAVFAKENGFEAFTTTLLGSPYQDRDVIADIGNDIANRLGLKFVAEDFRAGFKEALERARSKGVYIQSYCGCLFSEKERVEKGQAARVKGQGKKINA